MRVLPGPPIRTELRGAAARFALVALGVLAPLGWTAQGPFGPKKQGGSPKQAGAGPAGGAPRAAAPRTFQADLALPEIDPDGEPELGTRYPMASDRTGPFAETEGDVPVHDDVQGGADQRLLGLVGSRSGIAAVWQDGRDGQLGIYLGLLDREGELLPAQRPVHPPGSARELDPYVALGEAGRGAVTWFSENHLRKRSYLRLFTAADSVVAGALPIGHAVGPEARQESVGEGLDGPSLDASVALIGERGGYVAWREEHKVFGQAIQDVKTPLWRPESLGQGATGRPVASANGERVLVVWPTERGLTARVDGTTTATGPGELRRVLPDPGRGWWLLLKIGGGLGIRHLGPDGKPDQADLRAPAEHLHHFDLALWRGNLAVVTEEKAGGDARHLHGPIRLWIADRNGRLLIPPIPLPDPDARQATEPLVAASGTTIVVAWTDARERDRSIYHRVLRPKNLEARDRRFNNDRVSADQLDIALAERSGGRVIAAWSDLRDLLPRIWMRTFDDERGWLESDLPVSEVSPFDERVAEKHPGLLAMPDGRSLVAWIEERDGVHRLRARWFTATGRPAGPVFEPDGERQAHPTSAPALAFDPRTQRAVLVTARKDGSVAALSFAEGGTTALQVTRLDDAGKRTPLELQGPHELAGNASAPAVCALESGGFAVAWVHELEQAWPLVVSQTQALAAHQTQSVAPRPAAAPAGALALGEARRVVVLRLLDAAGLAIGPPRPARLSVRGLGDAEPVLVPTRREGFALAWTANLGPVRDVLVGLHDRGGEPLGEAVSIATLRNEQDAPALARLADGSLVCVWEDDLPGPDCVLARRLTHRGLRLEPGPIRQVHERETNFSPARTRPAVCRVGDGFLVAWDDRRRSKGHDLFSASFGPRFDRGSRRAPADSAVR